MTWYRRVIEGYDYWLQIVNDGTSLVVTWPDGHLSPYDNKWLQDRAFTQAAQTKRAPIYGRKHRRWGAEMKDKLQYFDYEEVGGF